MILISLHMPKTAGTSFFALLEKAFGEALLHDYDDRPLNRPAWRRKGRALGSNLGQLFGASQLQQARCVHGHFLPFKYRSAALRADLRFVTWLRDPVERLASHYYYWIRSYDPGQAGQLHRRVVEEGWDLERFCLGPELRNCYGLFLWRFPLQKFDFIGITEHYEEDVRAFCERFLGGAVELPAPQNVNEELPLRDADRNYIADDDFRRRVESHHAQDVALYRSALAMRSGRH